jgi:hypothetical protein
LLRDARPTARELKGRRPWVEVRNARNEGRDIEDKPNLRKAREAARARDIARAELLHLYLDARKTRQLTRLDPEIRILVEDLIRANGGKLPRLTLPPGRPSNLHQKMVIHLAVLRELEVVGRKRGAVGKAIASVALRYKKSPEVVRDIFYNRQPLWLKAVKLSLALRHGAGPG